MARYNPQVIKERIYVKDGKLERCDGNYKIKATDVRWIKFDHKKIRMRFVYEKGKKVSELVKKYNADFGINFPFFWDGIPLGDVEDNDKTINSAYGKFFKWHEFAWENGKPVIGQLDKNDKQDFLVQGSPLLIENGNLVYDYYKKYDETAPDIANSRAQRTFVGIDANNDLIIGIGDGRTSWDQGLNLQEMALFMQSKGAIWALNGDGGGSTVIADKNGKVLNQNSGNNERIVHHALLIYIVDEKEQAISSDNQDWFQINGEKALQYLTENGIVDTPEGWVNKLKEAPTNALVFILFERLLKQINK